MGWYGLKMSTPEQVRKQAADYVAYLKREHHLPILSAYLFGSHARGQTREWSDVDVCIISPLFGSEDPLPYLWTRRRRGDVENLLAPVGFTPEEFNAKIPSPLVAEIRKYGEEILVE